VSTGAVDPSELHDVMLGLVRAAAHHFGEREPSEEEMRAFFKERLVAMGKSPEEADAFLEGL
jgi:hypothetical protein